MFLTDEERKLTIQACRFCPMCFHADTVARITCRETNSPRGRALVLFALENKILKWDDPMIADIMYKSFTDGLPQEWCAGNYDHDELVIDARHRLVEKGLAPEAVKKMAERIQSKDTPYESTSPIMRDLFNDAGVAPTPGAELLVFLGCAARTLYPAVIVSLLKILREKEIAFNLLDPEPCCGMPLYQLGDFANAAFQARSVSDRIAESGAKEIILLDADCYRMFTNRFARFGAHLPAGLKISHVSEWFCEMLAKGKLFPKKRNERFTYHDACSMARFTKLHEPPRTVLASIFCKEPLEMLGSNAKALCCGEGGGMLLTNPEIAYEAALLRFEQARNIGAELIITSSPGCANLLSQVRIDGPVVKDLIELVEESF